jgi:hypothetical protein
MPATRGPVPKRTEVRRRTNAPEDGLDVTRLAGATDIEIPAPDEEWHPIAYDWYCSLEESGQATLYEPSDWMVAYLLAEQVSRLLNPRFVGMRQKFNHDVDAMETVPEIREVPMSGSDLSGLLKGMSNLMVTEADRRRMRVELTHGRGDDEGDVPAGVVAMKDARARLRPGRKAAGE